MPPSIAAIQRATCSHFAIPLHEMGSERRSQVVSRPRQIAMYLAKQLTPQSMPAIARRFGGRDHTTVLYANRRIEGLICDDPDLAEDVRAIQATIYAHEATSALDTALIGWMA